MPAKLNTQLKLDKILQFLLYIFLFLLPWQMIWIYRTSFLNGVKWEYGTLGFYATEGLLWVIIVLFIVWYCQRIKFQISNFKFQITSDRLFVLSLLSLISYLFISITWSSDKSLALQQSLRVMEAVLLFLVIFIGPFEKIKLAKWFIYGAILPSVLGIYQFVTQSTFASTFLGLSAHPAWEAGTSIIQSDAIGRWLRAYGPFSHPNVFGGYLVIVILLYCYIVSLGKVESGKWKVFIFISYLLSLIALFFTFSRSAWLAVVVGLLVYWFIARSKEKGVRSNYFLIPYSLFLILFLSIIYLPLIQTRFSSQSISEVRSTEERLTGFQEAWTLFKQHPMLGVGAGNYTLALYQMNSERPGWEYQPAHNAAVLFIVEQGVIGLLLVMIVILSLISYRLSFKNEIGDRRYYVFMFLCFIVLMLFDHYLFSSFIGLMLGTVYFALILRTSAQEFPS